MNLFMDNVNGDGDHNLRMGKQYASHLGWGSSPTEAPRE
jgi:hypothetical protein